MPKKSKDSTWGGLLILTVFGILIAWNASLYKDAKHYKTFCFDKDVEAKK